MVKDTVISLKLENDKSNDKIQEICADLCNLWDEVKAEVNGGHANSSEGKAEGNTKWQLQIASQILRNMSTTGFNLLKNLWNTCHLKWIKYYLHWIKHWNIHIQTTSSLWAFLKISNEKMPVIPYNFAWESSTKFELKFILMTLTLPIECHLAKHR